MSSKQKLKFIYTVILTAFLSAQPITAQTALPLDTAIKSVADSIVNKIPAKTKIAIINFGADKKEISDYVIEELWNHLATDGQFTIIDRKNIAAIEGELNFQANGMVSDKSAQSIGKMLGPQTIIYGKLAKLGQDYRMTIYTTQVEKATSEIETRMVVVDSLLAALLGSGGTDTMSLDVLVSRAVTELAQKKQTSVSIGRISLRGTYTVTNLSDFLKNSIVYEMSRQGDKFKVSDNSTQAAAIIEGSFAPLGRDAEVTLNLVSNAKKRTVLGSSKLIIPAAELGKRSLSMLPPQGSSAITQTAYDAKQKLLEPYKGKNNTFAIDLAPDHPDAIYYDGNYMTFTISTARDCYFKITHVDVDGNMQVIYPLSQRDNNFIKAGITRKIPDNSRFRLGKPFGEEYILVAAYDKPFVAAPGAAETLSANVVTRGLIAETDDTASVSPLTSLNPIATSMFSYTILP
ncbi:hypothetical protein FACS189494_09720 [Spirochaetia bacterium]|nr:hypothetical protein FACS189494_09720 [Spirochaetia bacterium]